MDGEGGNLRFFRFLNEGQNYIFNFYSHAEKLVVIMPGIEITLASACMCTDRLLEVWYTLHITHYQFYW